MKNLILILSLFLYRCGSSSLGNNKSETHPAIKIVNISKMNEFFNLLETGELEKFNQKIGKLDNNELNLMVDDKTLLMKAIEKSYEDIVNLLIQKGVDVNIANSKFETALYLAYKFRNENIKNVLLDNKAYLFKIFYKELSIDYFSNDALKIESNYKELNIKNFELMEKLLEDASDFEIENLLKNGSKLHNDIDNGRNIAFYMIKSANYDEVKNFLSKLTLLIKYGFDINISYRINQELESFFKIAVQRLVDSDENDLLLLKLLRNPNVNEDSLTLAFYKLINLRILNDEIKETFFKRKINLDVKIKDETILEELLTDYFFNSNDRNFLKELLTEIFKSKSVNFNIEGKTKNGNPILFLVAELNDFDILKTFIDRDAKVVNLKNEDGQTLLIYLLSSNNRYIEIIMNLINSSYNIDFYAKNNNNDSIYDILISTYYTFNFDYFNIIFSKLIQKGKVNLNFISGSSDSSIIEKLIENNLSFNRDEKYTEEKLNFQNTMVDLIRKGDIEKKNLNQSLYKLISKYSFDIEILKALLDKRGVDLNYVVEDTYSGVKIKESLLVKVIKTIDFPTSPKNIEIIKELLNIFIDLINKSNIDQESLNISLYLLISKENFDIDLLKALLNKKGVDLNYDIYQKSLLIHLIEGVPKDEELKDKVVKLLTDLIKKSYLEENNLNLSILYAIDTRSLALVKAIVEKGANLNIKYRIGNEEKTAIEYSNKTDSFDKEIYDYLKSK